MSRRTATASERWAGMALAAALLTTNCASAATALDAYRWSHRMLLVFTPSLDDPRAHQLAEALTSRRCDVARRDLVAAKLPENGDGDVDAITLPGASVSALRARYEIERDDFVVILIGKDGGAKLRTSSVPNLQNVFNLIDGMPMRMQEMRDQTEPCPD